MNQTASSAKSKSKEEQSKGLDSLNKQNTEAIEAVANALRNIGDNLNDSYNFTHQRTVSFAKAVSCAVMENCMSICVLLLKTSS